MRDDLDARASGGLLTVCAVAALGFAEACILCKKPVPLRFAVRFALHNAIPSIVWRTCEANLVCKAANLSSVALNEPSVSSECIRAARYIVASYGLLHQLLLFDRNPPAQTPNERPPAHRVVRLSSEEQQVTHLCKHERFLPMAWTSASREELQILLNDWCRQHETLLRSDHLIIEVDLSKGLYSKAVAMNDVTTVQGLIQPFRGPQALSRHMDAIVVIAASPWTVLSALDIGDVIVNTTSILSVEVARVIKQMNENTDVWIHANDFALSQGLLQENIVAKAATDSEDGVLPGIYIIDCDAFNEYVKYVEFLLLRGIDAANIICIQRSKALALPSGVNIVDVPRLVDQELAVIRAQLRCGIPTWIVQDNIRDKYGPLTSLVEDIPYRRDRLSILM